MWQWNKAIQITINSDDVTKENIKEHNGNWPLIPDNPYRILIIGGSESGKTISLFNLSYESDAKDPYEAKCHFLIAKQEGTGLRHLNDSKVQGTFSESRNKKKNVMLWSMGKTFFISQQKMLWEHMITFEKLW